MFRGDIAKNGLSKRKVCSVVICDLGVKAD